MFWSVIKKSKTLLDISCKENLKKGKNINKKISNEKLQLETSQSKSHKTPVRAIKIPICYIKINFESQKKYKRNNIFFKKFIKIQFQLIKLSLETMHALIKN